VAEANRVGGDDVLIDENGWQTTRGCITQGWGHVISFWPWRGYSAPASSEVPWSPRHPSNYRR
jgi:hypothetical protein